MNEKNEKIEDFKKELKDDYDIDVNVMAKEWGLTDEEMDVHLRTILKKYDNFISTGFLY